jgi:hypothetical protein
MNPFDRLPSLPADGYATHEVMNQQRHSPP